MGMSVGCILRYNIIQNNVLNQKFVNKINKMMKSRKLSYKQSTVLGYYITREKNNNWNRNVRSERYTGHIYIKDYNKIGLKCIVRPKEKTQTTAKPLIEPT